LITIEKARASRHTAAPTAESLISDDSCSDWLYIELYSIMRHRIIC
jgi:hypothetical protein